MLRSLLLILLVGVCLARVNYRTTNKEVSQEEKERILDNDDDDAAFAAFLSVYDDIEPDGFRGSSTPDELREERSRQKKIFIRNIQSIRQHNKRYKRGEVSYKMVVNSFAVMDEENRRMFLGLGKDSVNRRPGQSQGQADASLFNATDGLPSSSRGLGSTRTASRIDWRNKLGPIKDQQTCGSCWTFPATALLEFAIQTTTREKIPLSEQQLLDCTYEDQNYNACNGGWYYTAWDYVIKNGNKLARQSDYRYKNADGACYDTYYSNALAGRVKLESYYKVPASQVIDKMQISPLAVAFFVEQSFYGVGDGVFDGCYSGYNPSNHAVTLTGYGNGYWEIRNSWGRDWGNGGYARFKRSGTRSICNLLSDVYAIRTSSRDDGDDDRDDDGDDDDRVDPDRCSDNSQYASSCQEWADAGFCAAGNEYHDWMQGNCMKSCNACREEEREDDSDCRDLRTEAECRDWRDNYEYCTTGEYVEWMRTNCAKTCDACGEEETEEEEEEEEEEETDCRDNSEHASSCAEWRDQGFCQNDGRHEYYDWMSVNCAYTCGTCPEEEEEEPTDEASGDCEDSHEDCDVWASRGFCRDDQYEDYMRTNCRRSCDTCDEITEEPTPSEETEQVLRHSKVSQSSTMKVKKTKMVADLAVDGDETTKSQTKCTKKNAWFRYNFRENSRVNTVEIINGNFDKQRAKLNGAEIYVQEVGGLKRKCGRIEVVESSSKASQTYRIDCGGTYGSGIEISQKMKYNKKKCLEMKEVRVYGQPGEESEDESDQDDNDGCPGGTTRCPDGYCKHIHMC